MRRLTPILLFVFASLAAGAGIDGKWTSEFSMRGGKKQAQQARTVQMTLDLKAEGDRLTGKVSMPRGKRSQAVEIQEGKIEGNQFSFVTVQKGKKGEQKTTWQGTVEGDQLKGTRSAGKRGQPFTAKRG